ncbi:MAG: YbaB/EbfC family nucleoid-associated protein [Chloroflexota bacterium]|nr:YbaB/EbfC family nucleoid-associated protein [Chloroflexota bacterium]
MNRMFARQAQQLQQRLEKAQEELENARVEASAGGGAVTVLMNGNQQLKSVKISPEAVSADDVEMLEDMVMSAVNEASRKAQELTQSRLSEITGGIKIPGIT